MILRTKPFIVFSLIITYLQTPHFPPSLEQCLQYLQFLHALQFFEPVHVALCFDFGVTIVVADSIRVENDTSNK